VRSPLEVEQRTVVASVVVAEECNLVEVDSFLLLQLDLDHFDRSSFLEIVDRKEIEFAVEPVSSSFEFELEIAVAVDAAVGGVEAIHIEDSNRIVDFLVVEGSQRDLIQEYQGSTCEVS